MSAIEAHFYTLRDEVERLRMGLESLKQYRDNKREYVATIEMCAYIDQLLSGDSPAVETKAQSTCIDCLELKNALAAAVRIANEARECHDRDQDMRVMKILLALSGHSPKWRADTDRIHDVLSRAVERLDSAQETSEVRRAQEALGDPRESVGQAQYCPKCGNRTDNYPDGTFHKCPEKASTEPPKCTCTPPKFEGNERHGTFTSGRIDPNCPIHWRQTLIQNGKGESV